MSKPESIMIDDVKCVKESEIKTSAQDLDGMPYVVIRTYSAGVHAGYLKSQNGKIVELVNSRRLWFWKGAASLSQLSQDGVDESESKFPCEVPELLLTEAIETIKCTEKARLSIAAVKVWTA